MKLELLKKEKEENGGNLFSSEIKSKTNFNNIYSNFFHPKEVNILNTNLRNSNRNNTQNITYQNISLPSIQHSTRNTNSKSKNNSIIKSSKQSQTKLMKSESPKMKKNLFKHFIRKKKKEFQDIKTIQCFLIKNIVEKKLF